jgi:putative DNA primase/helicase
MARRPQGGGIAGINAAQRWLQQHGRVSERALAETFARDFDSRWRYNEDEGYWLQWVGTHWAKKQTPEFLDAIGKFAAIFADAFARIQQITNAEALKLQSQRTVGALERICRSLPSFLARAGLFDADPFLLGTPGGTVDLRTGNMKPASPDDYITVLTPITPAPPGTPLGPRFLKFIHDITGNDEDFIKTLQMWFGISATGTSRDQRILFLYGPGGNGKGVLLRTVSGLLGEHAVNAPRDLLMVEKYSKHTTHMIDVLKARMAIATEVDDDATWDVALVKDLTGGDSVSVQKMRHDPFRLIASCYITISGNKKPALKGIDEAVRRRFLVATFKLKVEAKDVIADLEKEFIREEGPAILRWIIDGSVARERDGKLHVAEVISSDTADYFAEENVLQDFIDTYLVTIKNGAKEGDRVKTSECYQRWKEYCKQSGRAAGAQNSFTTAMVAAGVEYHRMNDGRYFINVNMKVLTSLQGII